MAVTAAQIVAAPRLDPLVVTLLAERRRQGLSQEELAERAGVSRMSVGRFERGDRLPNLWTLRQISAALGLDLVLVCREVR